LVPLYYFDWFVDSLQRIIAGLIVA
jgi:hypothetical protein